LLDKSEKVKAHMDKEYTHIGEAIDETRELQGSMQSAVKSFRMYDLVNKQNQFDKESEIKRSKMMGRRKTIYKKSDFSLRMPTP